MRIRSHQIYPLEDLYTEYKQAQKNNEVFDAFTITVSVYVPAGKLLSYQDFQALCRRTKLHQYATCSSYCQYKDLQKSHTNAVLDNGVVLTIFTDFDKDEYEKAAQGEFVVPRTKLRKTGKVDVIYNSNKIEGIDTSWKDTETILAGGKASSVKYNDEISVLNMQDAFDIRQTMKGFVVDPYFLCRLHYELLKGLRDDAGRFRVYDVYIGSSSHAFPSFDLVPGLVQKLKERVSIQKDELTAAALLHAEFINIHPFGDGNGRIGRLASYPYTNIPFEHRLEYYYALDAYGKYKNLYPLYTLLYALNVNGMNLF